MKKKILNLVTFAMIGWGAISAIYLALPLEIKELLPNMNWVTAVVSGGSTTLLGSASLYIQNYINRFKTSSNSTLQSLYETLSNNKVEYENIIKSNLEIKEAYQEMTTAFIENTKLLKISLETKLDNPLLTEASRELIEGVLNEEESV